VGVYLLQNFVVERFKMTQLHLLYLNCLFKDIQGCIRWRNNLKNKDVFDLIASYGMENNSRNYDKPRILGLLFEIEGSMVQRTAIRKLYDFIKNCCSAKSRDTFQIMIPRMKNFKIM
jgi:hypothetical protein